jgi:hypothetical protein
MLDATAEVRHARAVKAASDGSGGLHALRLDGGDRVDCELAFCSIAHHPVTGLGEQLGCVRDQDGYLVWTPTAPPPSPASSRPGTSPRASSSSRSP